MLVSVGHPRVLSEISISTSLSSLFLVKNFLPFRVLSVLASCKISGPFYFLKIDRGHRNIPNCHVIKTFFFFNKTHPFYYLSQVGVVHYSKVFFLTA